MVILDTDIIIDHLRQVGSKETRLMKLAKQVAKENLAISVITVQELYEGISIRDEDKEQFLLATISPLRILSYTYETAQLAGEIARDRKGPMEFADSAIAATAILNDGQLLSLNQKDFKKIPSLTLYKL